jgi:ribosomal protein S16
MHRRAGTTYATLGEMRVQLTERRRARERRDSFMVDELGWYIYLQKKDYVKSAEALERSLASGMVPDAQIQQVLQNQSDLEKACGQLIDLANANGGNDNVTCVLARFRH